MEFIRSWFEWVDAFPTSVAFRESQYVYPFTLTAHVVGMCVMAGLVIMMDLRLLGAGNMRTPLSQVQRRLFPWQMFGMGLSALTGLLLVYGQPMRFYPNVFFWVKAVMMAMAGVNALAFHWGTYRDVAEFDTTPVTPLGARLAGGVSLALWACIIVSGRLIAYNWFQ
jgi:hypothetical protein